MTHLDLSRAEWRKSTRSDGGNGCVEVAAAWRKSSRSTGGNGCVEVARNLPGTVAVRDSKNPTGPALAFQPTDWRTFITGAKNGRFDL